MNTPTELTGLFFAKTPTPADDPTADRTLYAGLPDLVRAAMRCAAKRWNWGREDWRMQTHLIYDAIQSGRCSADAIAEGYQTGGPPC